jgi:hypothetical protein
MEDEIIYSCSVAAGCGGGGGIPEDLAIQLALLELIWIKLLLRVYCITRHRA